LPPWCRCPLTGYQASRLLLPRSGLERSDFVLWPIAANLAGLAEVSFRRLNRLDFLAASIAARDPKGDVGARQFIENVIALNEWPLFRSHHCQLGHKPYAVLFAEDAQSAARFPWPVIQIGS
jgi:hypothetical protein